MARLTVIMPVYNASRFLQDAVQSILGQTFKDFELWMINDASTDGSLSIINSFTDQRIKTFSNETNQGRVRTVNAIINKVSTPYFTITDADDVSHPQRLQKQIEFLEAHPDHIMCGTSYWAMDEQGFLVREMKLKTDVNELRAAVLSQSQFLGPTTVMRKSVVEEFSEFYRTYFISNFADADLSCRILDRFNATNLEEALYYYRVVRNSVTRKKISVKNLNLHRVIGFLSKQRREEGADCLQKGNEAEADEFMNSVQKEYDQDPSLFFRHQAFFHLYWGLTDLAFQNGWSAFRTRPVYWKNILGLGFIGFRIGLFLLARVVNKKHYQILLK